MLCTPQGAAHFPVQAFRCGAVAVSDPIGPCREVSELVIARYERAEWTEVDDLEETARGAGGFGSTGK